MWNVTEYYFLWKYQIDKMSTHIWFQNSLSMLDLNKSNIIKIFRRSNTMQNRVNGWRTLHTLWENKTIKKSTGESKLSIVVLILKVLWQLEHFDWQISVQMQLLEWKTFSIVEQRQVDSGHFLMIFSFL